MSKNSKSSKELRNGEPLPPHLLKPLIEKLERHSARVREHLVEYPDPSTVEEFDELTDDFKFPTSGFFGPDRDKIKGGNKGGKGGGGKGRRPPVLPNPAVVLKEVSRSLAHLPHAGMTGNLQIGEFNGEFLDQSKARYFQDSYIELVSRFHIVFLEEVDPSGVQHLMKVTGYHGVCGTANTRKQAVACLWHPRLKQLGTALEYTSIANVQGIPDLRPALRIDFEDTVTGQKFSVVVLHLKSMRGGPKVTSVVRHKQFTLLCKDLGPNFSGVVGGDMNFPLDNPQYTDADPMYQDGYTLVAAKDHTSTQVMGSRLDGFFYKGLSVGVDFYEVYAFFTALGRSFSDHAAIKVEMLVASKTSNQSAATPAATGAPETSTLVGGANLPILLRVTRATSGRSRKPRKVV